MPVERVALCMSEPALTYDAPFNHRRPQRQPPNLSALAAAANPSEDPAAAAAFLMRPDVRKHVCRLVYAEEWARSIEESHPEGQERDEVVQQHWHEVELIKRALSAYGATIEALTGAAAAGEQTNRIDAMPLKLKWF